MNQAAGRHRRAVRPKRPPSLLLVEYPGGDSRSGDYLGSAAFAPPGRRVPGTAPFGTRRTLVLAVAATLAAVVAAAVLGPSVLHRSGTSGGGHSAAPALPLTTSARPPAAAASPPAPAAHRPHRHHRTAARPAPPVPTSVPRTTPQPLVAPRSSPSPPRSGPLIVRYLIDSQGPSGFQGQVQVVNNSLQPIAGWQIVIALQGDDVTSFRNASGYFSNGILLLQPAGSGQLVPPDGGTLNVFFTANGTQGIPQVCAFNGIVCG